MYGLAAACWPAPGAAVAGFHIGARTNQFVGLAAGVALTVGAGVAGWIAVRRAGRTAEYLAMWVGPIVAITFAPKAFGGWDDPHDNALFFHPLVWQAWCSSEAGPCLGGLFLAAAGAWGRRGMNRAAAGGVVDGDE